MLGLVREQDVATRDFRQVTGLDTETQKALLEAKAKGSLDSRDIERYAPILREAPADKREEIVEEQLFASDLGAGREGLRRTSKRSSPLQPQ